MSGRGPASAPELGREGLLHSFLLVQRVDREGRWGLEV